MVNFDATSKLSYMKSTLIKITSVLLILSSATASAHLGPAPRPSPHPPRYAPSPRCAPPPRVGGEWYAVGGIAYLTGTVIRACTAPPVVVYTPSVRTVVVEPVRTVVVESAPTVVVSQPTTAVVVNSAPAVLSRETLRAELAGILSNSMQNIPYSVSVDNFYSMGASYGASITVVATVGGGNYSITAGGLQPSYSALKTYLSNEVVSAVGKLAAQSSQNATTTVVQIQ